MLVIIGDGDRLAQVVTSLVENALKYTPQDGEVLVLGGVENGSELVLVKEREPMIAPEDLGRFFEHFSQVDK